MFGGHMTFLLPPTFIPAIPMSQPLITSPRCNPNWNPGPFCIESKTLPVDFRRPT